MARTDEVFIDADMKDIVKMLERVFGGDLAYTRDTGSPYLLYGRTRLLVEHHQFPDDEEAEFSRYPTLIEVRDLDQNLHRQRKLAREVFDILAESGLPTMLWHDMQQLVDSSDPRRHSRAG
ncbi:MAG: hypothetical protein ACRDQA_26975 [Nocardioidaceae bacterium]